MVKSGEMSMTQQSFTPCIQCGKALKDGSKTTVTDMCDKCFNDWCQFYRAKEGRL